MLHVDIKKRFGDRRHTAFQLDVSFSVTNGITVLVGASGSGKTTCLRLIAGVLTPDEGRISASAQTYFDSSRKINLSIQRRRIGFVFQDYALFPHLTAERNIAYGVKADDRKTRYDKAREMLVGQTITAAPNPTRPGNVLAMIAAVAANGVVSGSETAPRQPHES